MDYVHSISISINQNLIKHPIVPISNGMGFGVEFKIFISTTKSSVN